jgi:hypothetical protein
LIMKREIKREDPAPLWIRMTLHRHAQQQDIVAMIPRTRRFLSQYQKVVVPVSMIPRARRLMFKYTRGEVVKRNIEETRGGVDAIYLGFDYISSSDFLFAHIVTPPLASPRLKKLRAGEATEPPAQNAKKLDKKLRLHLKSVFSIVFD